MIQDDEHDVMSAEPQGIEAGHGWGVDDDLGPRRLLIVIGVVCLAFVAISLPALFVRSPLGHDESVYALRASNLLDGWTFRSGNYWRDYRAPGLPIMLSLVARVTEVSVTLFRLVVVALGAMTLASTIAVGKMLRGWTVGVGAALGMMLTSGLLLASTTLLADVPGAAFAMLAIAAYVHDVGQGRLRWSFVIVPLACLASTLSRFGAPFMLGAGLLATAVVYAPEIIARRDVRLTVQSAVLAMIVGGVVAVVVLTDTFTLDGTSPATANADLVSGNGFTFSTGIADLWKVINPWSGHVFLLWSRWVAILFLVGVVAALISIVFDRSRARVVVFGLLAGLVSTFAIVITVGLVVPNYLALTLPFWALTAATGWDAILRAVAQIDTRAVRNGLLGLAGVVLTLLLVSSAQKVKEGHEGYLDAYANIRTASAYTGDQLGDDCQLIARYTPQAGFYSGCEIFPFTRVSPDDPANDLASSAAAITEDGSYGSEIESGGLAVMYVERTIRQPELADAIALEDLYIERLIELGEPGVRRQHVIVEVVAPCVADFTCPSIDR